MLKAGGEAKRGQLISQMEELSLKESKGPMTAEEAKIAAYGEKG